MISAEAANAVSVKDILSFLDSNVGKRVSEASKKGLLRVEQPFVLGELMQEETTLVQGIIDVYFEEEGELVVLDYKTDRVRYSKELIERYRTQLDYYAKALEQVTNKRVKEKIIYSFTLKEEIEV